MAQNKQDSAPPDATHFKSGKESYFLYLGCLELREIQTAWGFAHEGDSATKHVEKEFTFNFRVEHPTADDILFVLKTALGRWARANGVELTDDLVSDILAGLEPQEQKPAAKGFKRAAYLYQRLFKDCFGVKVEREQDEFELADPKDAGEASTPRPS